MLTETWGNWGGAEGSGQKGYDVRPVKKVGKGVTLAPGAFSKKKSTAGRGKNGGNDPPSERRRMVVGECGRGTGETKAHRIRDGDGKKLVRKLESWEMPGVGGGDSRVIGG